MKTLFTLVVLLLSLSPSQAQIPPFSWVKGIGGTKGEGVGSVAVDGSGNVYTNGVYIDLVDFDPGPGTLNLQGTLAGSTFVCKMDGSGNLVWAKGLGSGGGTNGVFGGSMAVDLSGNVYFAGFFTGTQDFDPGPGTFNLSTPTAALFIAKLNASGGLVWAKQTTEIGSDVHKTTSVTMSIDKKGSVYATGTFKGTCDFDPGPGTFNMSSSGDGNAFILKLDTAGKFIWAKSVGGAGSVRARSICTDLTGDVYTAGNFYGTVDFDPGTPTYPVTAPPPSQPNGFVLRLDSSGNFVWAKNFAGSSFVLSMAIDTSGNVCLTGIFSDTVDFDPGPAVQKLISDGQQPDAFIVKLNSSGNLVWVKSQSSNTNVASHTIALDKSGNIYCSGYYSGSLDFDPGPAVFNLPFLGSTDGFVCKFSPNGSFQWAFPLSGPGRDNGGALYIDAGGDLYAAGVFEQTVDFDPGGGTANLISAGAQDIFVLKLGNMPIPSGVSGVSKSGQLFHLYPNPVKTALRLRSSIPMNDVEIKLVNQVGQPVRQWTSVSGITFTVDLSNQPAGMYFVEILSKEERTVLSCVKQ